MEEDTVFLRIEKESLTGANFSNAWKRGGGRKARKGKTNDRNESNQ